MRVGHVTPFLAAGAAARFNNLAARDIISVGPNGLCCPAGVTVEVFPAYYSTVFNYGTEIDVFQCGTIKTIHKEQCPYTVVTSTYITSTVTGTLPPGCPTAPVSPTSISTSTSTISASTTITSSATLTTSTATTTIAPGAQFYLSYTGFPVAKRDVVEEKRQFLPGQTAVPIVVINGAASGAVPAPTANVVPANRCNEASLLTLVNGQLRLAGTNNAIAKQSGTLQAALGYLINVASNAVNTTFAFNGNVLSWVAPDVGNANFFACPNGIQVGFPTFTADGCIPVQLVAVAQNACSPSSTTSTSSTSSSTSTSTSSSVTSTSSSSSTSTSSTSTSSTSTSSTSTSSTSTSSTSTSSTSTSSTSSTSTSTTTPGSNTVGPTSISTTVISSTTITLTPSSSSTTGSSSTSTSSSSSSTPTTITSTISTIATTTTSSTISTISPTGNCVVNLPNSCAQLAGSILQGLALQPLATACLLELSTTVNVGALPGGLQCLTSVGLLATGATLNTCLVQSGLICGIPPVTTTSSATATTSSGCTLPILPAACQNFQSLTSQVDLLAQAATCSAAILTTLQVQVLPTSLSCLLSTNILLGTTGQSLEQCLVNSGLFCAGSIITTLPTTTATSTSLLPITIPTCLNALPATCQAVLTGGALGLVANAPGCTTDLTAAFTNGLVTQAPVTAALNCVAAAVAVALPNTGTITTLGNCLTSAIVCGAINNPTTTTAPATTTSSIPVVIPTSSVIPVVTPSCLNALPATCQALLTGGALGLVANAPGCTTALTAAVTNGLITQTPVTTALNCVAAAVAVALPNTGTITTLSTCLNGAVVCQT